MNPIYSTSADRSNQAEVAGALARGWGCELYEFGEFCPLDWWARRDGQLVGVAELKCRNNPSTQYPTVYLSVRKWIALLQAQMLGVPGVFIVRFSDNQIRWIYAAHAAAAGAATLAGDYRAGGVVGRNGIEPVLEVPIDEMTLAVQGKPPW